MITRIIQCAATVVAMLAATGGFADEPAALAHNPFSRPPSALSPDAQPVFADDGSVRLIDLRATMVSSTDSLANIAGRTIRPGDEVQGYKLLRVFEDRAVFSRGGTRLTVYVKPELADNDE